MTPRCANALALNAPHEPKRYLNKHIVAVSALAHAPLCPQIAYHVGDILARTARLTGTQQQPA